MLEGTNQKAQWVGEAEQQEKKCYVIPNNLIG
jgi:hypothetical protein